jgi:hypothetical protein
MPADLDRYACDARFPGLQSVRLIRRALESTRLDLKGLRVLTEASVGYRRVTPVIAALAGADEVYAVGRDTVVSSRREAEEQTAYLAELAHVGARVRLFSTRLQAPLDAVDIVTDLPGVRPVDESIIRNVAETAAVTLMRGTEHWRSADVDVATCRRRGIAVAGLDEEAVGLFRYAPQAVLAALHDVWYRPATDRPYHTSCRHWRASARACSSRRLRPPAAPACTAARRPATGSPTPSSAA